MFVEHFDIVTAKYKAQVEDPMAQIDTHELISIFTCRVDNLVNEGWPDYDGKN